MMILTGCQEKTEVGSSVCKYGNGDNNGPLNLTWERKQKYLLEEERENVKLIGV